MLYLEMEISKNKVQAMVDTGAQTTVMSKNLAEKCGIMRLVDQRFAGMAVGVGVSKIVGKIHAIDVSINGNFLPLSISVVETDKLSILFGLDMMKRHNVFQIFKSVHN